MAATGAIKAGQAYIELFAEDSKLRRGLKGGEKLLTEWGTKVAALGAGLIAGGAAILGPLGAAVSQFAAHGSNLDDMAQRTGASVEALSELEYAAQMSGTSLEAVEGGMRKLQKVTSDAAGGSKAAAEALAKVGLTARDLEGWSPDAQLEAIAEGLAAIEDPGERAAAMAIFGKNGTELLPLLQNGKEGLKGMREEAARLGLTMSSEDAQAAAELGDSWDTLLSVLGKLTDNIGAALAPALTEIVQAGAEIISTVSKWVDQNRELTITVAAVAAGVVGAGVALVAAGGLMTALGAIAGGASVAIGALGTVLAAIVSPVGLVAVAAIAAAGAILYFTGTGKQALSDLAAVFGTLHADASTAMGGIADALKAGNLTLAAEILWATLQLEWARGTAAVTEIWNGFAALLYDNFAAATNGIQELFINSMAAVMSALSGTIQDALALLDSLLEKLSSIPGVGTLRMAVGAAGSVMTPEAIERNREAQVKDLRDSAAKAQDEREAARLKSQADAIENIQKAEEELRRKREEAAKQAEQTAQERTKSLTARSQAGQDKAADLANASAVGTFNGAYASLIGGGGVMNRVATASEKTAENTKKTAEKLDDLDDSLTFG